MAHAKAPYDNASLVNLFDEMSATYGFVNLVASFGFAHLWRRACIRLAQPRSGEHVLDLMTGMGECFGELAAGVGKHGAVLGVDFSHEMIRRAGEHGAHLQSRSGCAIAVEEADVFTLTQQTELRERFDVAVCNFGLKTLAPERYADLVRLLRYVLKPGGRFVFLEISVPSSAWLRMPYLFYLHRVIPWIGRLCLGNPDNYRMLGIYTENFRNCAEIAAVFREAGLENVREHALFFGCATAVSGARRG